MNPKVTTRMIVPHPLLQPHLRYIGVRNFDTGDMVFPKAIIAENEIQISIFLDCRLHGFQKTGTASTGYTFSSSNTTQCYYTAIHTSTKGFIEMHGKVTLVTLHFKPAGFYHIFRISPKSIFNLYGEAEDIFGSEMRRLYEHLMETAGLLERITILEQYLIQKLQYASNNYRHKAIQYAADCLCGTRGNYSIKRLAENCNVSLQTLEVRFAEIVGLDPKSFASIVRFNATVVHKLYNPACTWTHIAHANGYFDQAHLIKAFKRYSGLSPKEFMRFIHPPFEEFIAENR
ncbi:AraC family transcriptional regulator [Parapedobacter defluvii]|uniref:helix-turn-helix domain-containing protein n=1 Tax=Parapedobacter defluvii TaxID=2045106 RepID=UPI00333E1A8E